MEALLYWNWGGETPFPGDSAQQVAVGRNADGRLEIFYVGTNNVLYHNWQIAPNGDWVGETQFPGDSAQQVAVGQNADGRLEIFYVGTNNILYHNWQVAPNGGGQLAPNGGWLVLPNQWKGETPFPGDSAQQVDVGQNADGRLEIFYVGTNNDLYHNWQVAPNGGWADETRFPGESAQQVAMARNKDGRLEVFYVGTNQDIYHVWQVAPNGVWAGETQFPGDSAQQLAVAPNQDGRLEVFYVGTNSDLYHNWQTIPNSGWNDADGVGSKVTVPASGLGSNSNYLLASGCNYLTDVMIIITVTEDIILKSNSAPVKGQPSAAGFTWQLNCYSPKLETSAWQQYAIGFDGDTVYGQINNWSSMSTPLLNEVYDLANPGRGRIPAGYLLTISLRNDSDGNLTGVKFSVIDGDGEPKGAKSVTLTSISGVSSTDLSPIVAFELNLVGPGSEESAVLSSGAGSIQYQASSLLTVGNTEPSCAEVGFITGETANSLYGEMTGSASNLLSQSFGVATVQSAMIHKPGRPRPPLTPPRGRQ